MAKELGPLTDNGKKMLAFMQANDQIWVGKDLGEAAEVKGWAPVMNSLVRRGFAVKTAPVTRDFTAKDGSVTPKDYVAYELTEAGRDFII